MAPGTLGLSCQTEWLVVGIVQIMRYQKGHKQMAHLVDSRNLIFLSQVKSVQYAIGNDMGFEHGRKKGGSLRWISEDLFSSSLQAEVEKRHLNYLTRTLPTELVSKSVTV